MFFPDTCEIAHYGVTAGALTTDKAAEPPSLEDLKARAPVEGDGMPSEGGAQVGVSFGMEGAVYRDDPIPGHANAESFKGFFHTVELSLGVAGASRYVGDKLASGGYWTGGTLGAGIGGGAASLDWDYSKGTVVKLDETGWGDCLCRELIYTMVPKMWEHF